MNEEPTKAPAAPPVKLSGPVFFQQLQYRPSYFIAENSVRSSGMQDATLRDVILDGWVFSTFSSVCTSRGRAALLGVKTLSEDHNSIADVTSDAVHSEPP